MRIPDHIISQVADRLDMVSVVSAYVALEKRGGRYWGLCPFHQEKTPSFTVTPEKSVFYCFGCHKGGSIFTLIMELEKLSFVEAVRFLAEKAGIDRSLLEVGERDVDSSRRAAYLELYRRVTESFHHILLNHRLAAPARDYLMSRGINQDALVRFRLGYALPDRDWLFRFLRDKNYSVEFLKSCGLFSRVNQEPLLPLFRARIIFPIRNHRGEVIAFGGRSLVGQGNPKYLNSPETPYFRKGEHLFGAPEAFKNIREHDEFVMVEGYMDVLALVTGASLNNCVAPLGTALTGGQLRLLKRYTQQGLFVFDGDEAGFRATQKAALLCEQLGFTARVIELPGETDPADILEKEGPQALEALIKKKKKSINTFQFLLNRALKQHDAQTPDGKQAIFNQLRPYLAVTDSQVKRDGYLRMLAERLEVGFESVRHDFLSSRMPGLAKAPDAGGESKPLTPDLYLLLAVAVNPDYFPYLRGMIGVDDLEDQRARALYIVLEESFRGEERSVESLLARLDDPQLETLLLEKISSEEFSINQDRLIRDGVRRLKQRALEDKRSRLSALLTGNGIKEPIKLKELLAEKIYLDEELQKLKVMPNDRSTE